MGKYSAYHKREIHRGEYGELSKISEEIVELVDAEEQGDYILCCCELSDIFGAFEGWIDKYFPEYSAYDLMLNIKDVCITVKDRITSANELLVKFNEEMVKPAKPRIHNFSKYFRDLLDHPMYLNVTVAHLKMFSDNTKNSRRNLNKSNNILL